MPAAATAREAAVWARLARVTDPELDEPVTELGFVTGVAVDAQGGVRIGFRLPTYWCAANFAFIMADDMRREVASLPWVAAVELGIDAHMYAEAINNAMKAGLSFQDAFPAEASQDLSEVRQVFAVKAFQRRQEALLRHLLAAGQPEAALLAMTNAELASLQDTPELILRYQQRRSVAGPVQPEGPAFVDQAGRPIPPGTLAAYLRRLRMVSVNTEFNGALCRGLLAARYGEAPNGEASGADREPELIDFIRQIQRV